MNYESSPNERWVWKFTYKGEDLLPFARRWHCVGTANTPIS
jgi:hypothetical protein